MDTKEAARAWIDAWSRAWRAHDADLLASIYTPETVHHSHPFRDPGHPIDYARRVLAEEEGDPEVWMGEPVVSGNRAAIEWWAVITENGEQVSLAGTSVVRFDGHGRTIEQSDYWGTTEGRVAPWPGWASSAP